MSQILLMLLVHLFIHPSIQEIDLPNLWAKAELICQSSVVYFELSRGTQQYSASAAQDRSY